MSTMTPTNPTPPLIDVWYADFDAGIPQPRQCVTFGWPNKTVCGETMYDNKHYLTREEAWDCIRRDLEAREAFVARDIAEAKRKLLALHCIRRDLEARVAFVARDIAEAKRKLLALHEEAAKLVQARVAYTETREREP